MSGNLLFDPCFSSPRAAGLVLCATAPWRNAGVKLRLTAALPRAMANHGAPSLRNQPWALELLNGRRCLFTGGATASVEGKRLNYFCTAGASNGLWGFPDRRGEPWSILSAPAAATHLRKHEPIRRAWM
jgi:hypothetical protein